MNNFAVSLLANKQEIGGTSHTIIECEYDFRHVTLVAATNYVAGGDDKCVVGEWQHPSGDVVS